MVSGHPETSGAVGSWISFVISTEEKSHNSYNMINKIKFIFETKMYLISIFPLLFLIFIDNFSGARNIVTNPGISGIENISTARNFGGQ